MKIEDVKARLAQIDSAIEKHNKQMQQIVATINMLQGGRNECLVWIEQLTNANTSEPSQDVTGEENAGMGIEL